jgi:tripartite-type tricarboxylate transporter receptor subunit TctC
MQAVTTRRGGRRQGRWLAVLLAGALLAAGCGNVQLSGNGGGGGEEGEVPSRITLVIPFPEAGGTDLWGRFFVPYLEKHLPGNPAVLPENRPGGESITGTNKFVTDNATDGSELLVSSATTTFQWMLGRDEAKYDFTKLEPLMINGTGGVIYASKASGITGVEDLKQPPKPLSYGAISASGLDLLTLLAFEILELDVKSTIGFEGRAQARLALERGEINLDYQTTSAYQTQVKPMVDKGTAVPLMTFGSLDESGEIVRDEALPDLPTVPEVYEQLHGSAPSGPAMEAYRAFLAAGFTYQKGMWVVPDVPESVRTAYMDAFEAISKDKDFQAKSEEILGGYPMYRGDEVGDALRKSFQISDEARSYVTELLATKYDTKL